MWPFKKKPEQQKYIVVDCAFNCMKEKCPKWVIMCHTENDSAGNVISKTQEGRCAAAWIPYFLADIVAALQAGTADKKE